MQSGIRPVRGGHWKANKGVQQVNGREVRTQRGALCRYNTVTVGVNKNTEDKASQEQRAETQTALGTRPGTAEWQTSSQDAQRCTMKKRKGSHTCPVEGRGGRLFHERKPRDKLHQHETTKELFRKNSGL